MTKITADHLARGAYVYIRQSTSYQVANNTESGRRQYGLVERARQLGFPDVHVIDDDLGRSGGGIARPGFEKLLAAICARRVGAVLSIEASRLARNGRDWHTLLEFCGLVETVIIDEDGVYDPRMPNDRLLLGMKGTMSEMETSVFRQRSMEAMKQKARRGELFLTVAVGYEKTDDDRIEKTPDQGVQDAINLVFSKFAELQTVRQVLVWMRQEQIPLPAIVQRAGQRALEWKLPVYHTLHHMLTNPVYAGAYAFGRRRAHVTIESGRKRVIRTLRRNWDEWEVLIKRHHDGYIRWEEFERNQRLIADNANGKSYLGRGSVRRGEALLPGLLRCARCGRRLQVSYGGSGSLRSLRYACRGAFSDRAEANCISFGGVRVDRALAQEVVERVQPIGVEAALVAMKNFAQEQTEKRRQLENALEQARFEASRALRQYDAVDPENRLVASNLERRWNERLLAVRALEEQLEQLVTAPATSLREEDRERLLALGRDLSHAWDSPGVSVETRKKIVRLLISEIIVDVIGDTMKLIIRWQGGDHTRLDVKKNKVGQTRWVTDTSVVELVQALARHMADTSIATVLNRAGKSTGRGNGWTRSRVCSLRHQHGIAPYVEGERQQRGEATLREAAELLAVSPSTILRMISTGLLPAKQLCKAAPWVLGLADLQRDDIKREADRRRLRRPASHASHQVMLDL
jgi:DNA invertase Pin-like site-specific DNA recombinase